MSSNPAIFSILLCLFVSVSSTPQADSTLFDFESQKECDTWILRSPQQDKLSRSSTFATSGAFSLCFETPRWREGMEEWPALEAKPSVQDWREYDRLLFDVIHPHAERHSFSLFISDDKVPFRNGLSFRIDLPSKGWQRYEIPLSLFPQEVDRSRISLLHFYSQRPATDMVLYLDNLVLLRGGEEKPLPSGLFVQQMASLFLGDHGAWEKIRIDCRKALKPLLADKKTRKVAEASLLQTEDHIDAALAELSEQDLTLDRIHQLKEEMDRLPRFANRKASEIRFRQEFDRKIHQTCPMLVGFASSMVKLLPRNMPFELDVADRVELSLAKNEKESLQVAVLPRQDGLKQVLVRIGPLVSRQGHLFPASQIDCHVVGYVKTEKRPPYAVSHVGWWPDPILDFLGPIDVAPGDLQSFWIRIRADKDQPAGKYHGMLSVEADEMDPLNFDLTVRVYDFVLPDHTPLPTAITFSERKSQMGGEENWDHMKHVYADFLADYLIDYDSLYRKGGPDFEVLQRLHDQGRLVAFNLGNVFNAGAQEEGFEQAMDATVERIRPSYDKAKALGLIDHAYIYGFDERSEEQFPLLERSAQALKKAFPEALLMTTSYDHSYGLESCAQTIDAWCPLTSRYDRQRAEEVRIRGKKVWWYICCGPHHPFANWFVEYDAIEARLLMGPMTIKYRPDGFLYYALCIWNENQPITNGPFTDWNPVSWTVYHGDGSILCSGPGGKPVPTLRLENYRDGQEDYAYACILEEILGQIEAQGNSLRKRDRRWLDKARAALEVPNSLVESMSRYSTDPKDLYAYRNRLADLIETSGIHDANPWGEDFGVRGFRP